MKFCVSLFTLLAVLAGSASSWAGSYGQRTYRTAAAQANVRLNTGLVIVPFAVPVAVPVATVTQPGVLYSYRQYALPQPAEAAPVAPPTAAASQPQQPTEPLDGPAVLAKHCASCHTGAAVQGDLQIFQAPGRIVEKLPRQSLLEAVEQGRMPQPASAPRLTPQEIEILRQWARPPRDLAY